jgi:ABC-type multidrug transport system permease subunit
MYQLTENELSNLQSAGNYKALDIAVFSLCAGILVTVIATLTTVDIANAKTFAGFIALGVASGIATLFFGVRAFLAWRAAERQLDMVKRGEAAER